MKSQGKYSIVSKVTGKGLFIASLLLLSAPALAVVSYTFTKTPTNGIGSVGVQAQFTYTITNTGTEPLTAQQLEDPLPGTGVVDWSTSSPECAVGGAFPGPQVLTCDLSTLLLNGNQNIPTVEGIPNACIVLESTATVDPDNAEVKTATGKITIPCPATAMFVVGDVEPHGVGADVYFWGSQWWKNNQMSGFVANGTSSFKGYASNSTGQCGGTWVSRVGNTAPPPDLISSSIMVIVTDTVTKNGPDLGGNIKQILVVTPAGGYGPAPGHKDHGVVTQIVCSQQ